MTPEVLVTERFTCPECKGSGKIEGFVPAAEGNDTPLSAVCAGCFGNGHVWRTTPLEKTGFWIEFRREVFGDQDSTQQDALGGEAGS